MVRRHCLDVDESSSSEVASVFFLKFGLKNDQAVFKDRQLNL